MNTYQAPNTLSDDQEMRNNSIACNTITYNTMLDACAKCSCMEKASM